MSRSLAYKYRSGEGALLARDLDVLRNSKIYAASRETLNDPFEGRFDRGALDEQLRLINMLCVGLNAGVANSFQNLSESVDDLLAFVDKCGVFSLSYNPLNELIWAHYAGSHQGYCVGYDLDRLLQFDITNLQRIEVRYGNSSPSLIMDELVAGKSPVDVLNKLLGSKSLPWKYEEEVRVVATSAGLYEHDFRAVCEVYFGLRCAEGTRLSVMEALAGRGVSYKQVVSPHPSYLLEAKSIPDAYASAPKYRERVAPIMEGVINTDYLKPSLKPYAEYLTKAAEIVRRDPYCEEVQCVDFSPSMSTPENPVVLVQCLRGSNKWFNHYLTLKQIDEQYGLLMLKNDGV